MRTQAPLLLYTHPGSGELRRRRWFLEILDGPDQGTSAELDHSPALLGEAPASVVRIGDDTVSRYHAELEIFAEGVRLRDLDSTNGTFLGEEQIRETFLEENDEFRVGRTSIRLRAEDEPAASEIDTDPHGVPPGAVERVGHALAVAGVSRELLRLVRKIAPSTSAVIFEGETGVGRATLARLLHDLSPRKASPFVTLSLKSGVDPDELAQKLFGRGSSGRGGTLPGRPSLFEAAKGGTLFFEDIENLPAATQIALLRAIERGEIQRIGDDRKIRIDVRVVGSTTLDLAFDHNFDRGLFRRLAVVRLRVPSVRDRAEDVRALAAHFATQLLGNREPLGPRALSVLEGRELPGNFDQLRVLVGSLTPKELTSAPPTDARFGAAHGELANRLREAHITDVVARHRGNVSRASQELSMEAVALFRYLQKHDVELDAL